MDRATTVPWQRLRSSGAYDKASARSARAGGAARAPSCACSGTSRRRPASAPAAGPAQRTTTARPSPEHRSCSCSSAAPPLHASSGVTAGPPSGRRRGRTGQPIQGAMRRRHTKDLGVAHDLQPWRDARRATAPRPHLAAMPGSRGTTPGCPGTSSSTVGPSVRHGPAGVALLSLVTTSRRQCPGLSVLGSAEQTKPRIACAAHGGPKVNACWLHPRARDTDAHSALLSLGWRAMLRHWPELDKPYRHAAPHGAARSLQQKMERERAVAP